MTNNSLAEFIANKEWYDNSKIKLIRGCKRKAFLHVIGPRGVGLELKVGDGANAGSCYHAGLARYYNNWGKLSEPIRRVHAARAFMEEWQLYFPHDHMQSKHRLDRGLEILDAYFDHYLHEDELYEPVEAELGFVIEISCDLPESQESSNGYFNPFMYVGRVDGIFKRIETGELFLRETKTTGNVEQKALEKRLKQLKFDHQPIGYTYCVRHLAGPMRQNVLGVMGDIIGVGSKTFGFARDYFHISEHQTESWRRQLINTVEDWRTLCEKAHYNLDRTQPFSLDLDRFYQDTERCFEYGKCAFYELCDYGISDESLSDFAPDTWNPLLKRTPANIEIASTDPTLSAIRR